MPSPAPRPVLSVENSDRLRHALVLTRELQSPGADAERKLTKLRVLLEECRDGIRRQRPAQARYRLKAVGKARNYLHFLPATDHPEAEGRLKSVARRLQHALRTS